MLIANTMSLGYAEREDRLLLACADRDGGTVEFWLTRRLTARLLATLAGLLESTSARVARAPAAMRGEVLALEYLGAQSDQPAAGKVDAPPVQPHKERHLVDRLDIEHQGPAFRLRMFAQGQAIAGVAAQRADLHRLLGMLDRAAGKAGWELDEAGWLTEAKRPQGHDVSALPT